MKLFAKNKMAWTFDLFCPFLNVEEKSIFLGLFWKNLSKTYNQLRKF